MRLVRTSPEWLLAGDFNALPPGDDPSRLGPELAAQYPEARPAATPSSGVAMPSNAKSVRVLQDSPPLEPLYTMPDSQPVVPLSTLIPPSSPRAARETRGQAEAARLREAAMHEWHTCKRFSDERAMRTLDHAFCSSGWHVESCRVMQTKHWPSDHLPIVACLRLSSAARDKLSRRSNGSAAGAAPALQPALIVLCLALLLCASICTLPARGLARFAFDVVIQPLTDGARH